MNSKPPKFQCPRKLVIGAVALIAVVAFVAIGSRYTSTSDRHENAMDSVCRVVLGPNQGGTGFVFYDDGDDLWIMTAGHLVSQTTECDLYFYMRHEPTGPIRARVVAVGYNHAEQTANPEVVDVALLRVSKHLFGGGSLPSVARLAPIGTEVELNQPIFSVGSPNLSWPTAWFGHVAFLNERSFWFNPDPAPGRSGSPVFDHDANYVVGMIVWHGPLQGRAISSEALYQFLFSRNLVRLTTPRLGA